MTLEVHRLLFFQLKNQPSPNSVVLLSYYCYYYYHWFFLFNFSFATRVANYKLPMFSEVYDCMVEFQYTYMKFKKKINVFTVGKRKK